MRNTQAELMAYRSQINPHFLFNTLDCISGMARYYEVAELEKLVTALTGCSQYTLRTPDVVCLEQEIQHVRNYMDVMELRMPGTYTLRLNVQAEAMQCKVLSLMLQPLVENAIMHGLPPSPCSIWWISGTNGGTPCCT